MTTHTHTEGPDTGLPIALGITGLLLAAACWAMLQGGGGGGAVARPAGLEWPAPAPLDMATLNASWEGQRQAAHKLVKEPAAIALIEAAQIANEHQFTTHPIPARDPRELAGLLDTSAGEAMLISSPERFLAIGEPMFAACTKELGALLVALGAGKVTWEIASADPDVTAWSGYRKNCGNILPELARTKLIDQRGGWRDERAPLYFELWQRYRWAFMIQEHRPALLQLSPVEREALLRWRIEDGGSFDHAARLRALDEARDKLTGYPFALAHALILIERGDQAAALDSLRAARQEQPQDRDIERWLGLLEAKK